MKDNTHISNLKRTLRLQTKQNEQIMDFAFLLKEKLGVQTYSQIHSCHIHKKTEAAIAGFNFNFDEGQSMFGNCTLTISTRLGSDTILTDVLEVNWNGLFYIKDEDINFKYRVDSKLWIDDFINVIAKYTKQLKYKRSKENLKDKTPSKTALEIMVLESKLQKMGAII